MNYIVVSPVGSKFAKALQQGLAAEGIKSLRISPQRWLVKQQRRNNKAFVVTSNPLNKVEQFVRFKESGVASPNFTLAPGECKNLPGKTVFARTLINATNGRGIVEFEKGTEPPPAPLYTEYIPKKAEYRVHVFDGKVIDVQQKKKKRGFEDQRNTRIRNLHNGYVYTRADIVEPEGLQQLAVDAVAACGYSYGACDIIYNEKQNKCFVLEVNSRPGLMGSTVNVYVNAIKERWL